MKPTKILSLVSFFALTLAGVANAREGAARRGQVNVPAAATKAVVAGPVAVKVYSGFSGAKIFVAEATTGSDADCVAGAHAAGATALQADHIEILTVRSGQVACVASTGEHTIELLWRAKTSSLSPTLVVQR
jgi:hypothetical protein